jgi:hypothetical protein
LGFPMIDAIVLHIARLFTPEPPAAGHSNASRAV